ncbi:MAG: CsbD family protein [Pseudomonadota bacterium]
MNWDQIEGKWKQLRGSAKEEWGKLTDDDLDRVEGKREKLIGVVQETYGINREEADKQISRWFDRL